MKKRELLERIEALEKENTRLRERLGALEARPWQGVLPSIAHPLDPIWPLPWTPGPIITYSDNTAMIDGETSIYTKDLTTDGQPVSIL